MVVRVAAMAKLVEVLLAQRKVVLVVTMVEVEAVPAQCKQVVRALLGSFGVLIASSQTVLLTLNTQPRLSFS
jgi:hypothetical protein